jgi:hypothetical protein
MLVTNSVHNIISLVDTKARSDASWFEGKSVLGYHQAIHPLSKSGELDNHGSNSVFSAHRTNHAILWISY